MQAILITCYKDKENLFRLLRKISDKDVNIYIHIDKKSKIINVDDFGDFKNVKVIKKYSIPWGSSNHIKAIMLLARMALNDNNDYYHIISGQDYLTCDIKNFISLFNKNNNIYMSVMSLSEMNKENINRYKKGTFCSVFSSRNYLVRLINILYGLFRNKGGIGEFKDVYKGLIWCSMPADPIKYCIDYYDNNISFRKALYHCIIPEEFFFQTILMNSKYKNRIIKNDLRYNDWNYRNGSYPAYLDITDYDKIIESKDVWIRKIDSNISYELINKIDCNDILIEGEKSEKSN